MKNNNYFSKAILFIRQGLWGAKKSNTTAPVVNELIHPRFEMDTNDAIARKAVPNSLLFLMYSKENDVLFI